MFKGFPNHRRVPKGQIRVTHGGDCIIIHKLILHGQGELPQTVLLPIVPFKSFQLAQTQLFYYAKFWLTSDNEVNP